MTSPTELLIARHGEAHCNVNQLVGGPTGCTGLTNLGRRQAQQLAGRLHAEHTDQPFAALLTSPLRRAAETAAIIATTLRLCPQEQPDLAEADYGTADGHTWNEVVRAFDGIPANEPHRPIAPGAETWAAYLERARAAINALLHRHQGERIIVIGHGETVVAAAHHFLNLPADSTAKAGFATHPASLTRWAQQPASWVRPDLGWRWALVVHNDTAHLSRTQWPT